MKTKNNKEESIELGAQSVEKVKNIDLVSLHSILANAAIRGLKPATSINVFRLINQLKEHSEISKEVFNSKLKEYKIDSKDWVELTKSKVKEDIEIVKEINNYFEEQNNLILDTTETGMKFEFIPEEEFFKFVESRTIDDVVKGDDGKVVKIKRELEYSGAEIALLYRFLCKKK